MEIGKLPNAVLEEIVINNIKYKRQEVLLGSKVGEDTGIVDFGDDYCVVSTDPITGATKNLGKLAVYVTLNDAATKGAEPIALLITLLCPVDTKKEEIDLIMKEASEAAKEEKVEIIGGHTEITDAVNRIIINSTVLARLKKQYLLDYNDIRIGDKLIVTKYLGLEGTNILVNELGEKAFDILTKDEIELSKQIIHNISVVKEGKIGKENGALYMHDITEGGLYGAVWEASNAIGKGIIIYEEKIPLLKVTRKICDVFEINPFKLISSGSMLMIVPKERLDEIIFSLGKDNILATCIGEIVEDSVVSIKEGLEKPIESPKSDELYKALKEIK